jgi:hypothetical protein
MTNYSPVERRGHKQTFLFFRQHIHARKKNHAATESTNTITSSEVGVRLANAVLSACQGAPKSRY